MLGLHYYCRHIAGSREPLNIADAGINDMAVTGIGRV